MSISSSLSWSQDSSEATVNCFVASVTDFLTLPTGLGAFAESFIVKSENFVIFMFNKFYSNAALLP